VENERESEKLWRERKTETNKTLSVAENVVVSDLVNVGVVTKRTDDGNISDKQAPFVVNISPAKKLAEKEQEAKKEVAEQEDVESDEGHDSVDVQLFNVPVPSAELAIDTKFPSSSPLSSSASISSPLSVWDGSLDFSTFTDLPSSQRKKFSVSAFHVNGPDLMWLITRGDSLSVKGRMDVSKLYKYLSQIQTSSTRQRTAVFFEPTSSTEPSVYDATYKSFVQKEKVAVMSVRIKGNSYPCLEETYLFAMPEAGEIPVFLRPRFQNTNVHGKLVGIFITRMAPSQPFSHHSPRRKSSPKEVSSPRTDISPRTPKSPPHSKQQQTPYTLPAPEPQIALPIAPNIINDLFTQFQLQQQQQPPFQPQIPYFLQQPQQFQQPLMSQYYPNLPNSLNINLNINPNVNPNIPQQFQQNIPQFPPNPQNNNNRFYQ